MKIKLEFDGNDPSEEAAARRAFRGTSAYCVLFDMREWLIKRRDQEQKGTPCPDCTQQVLNHLIELMHERGVDLEDLE